MVKITPVIMSGGAGTRLWPVSRVGNPKQFHRLGSERTLIQETALRVSGDLFGPPIVVASADHLSLVREQLAEIGVTPRAILLEPVGRNTGPASAAAAAYAAREAPEGLLMLVHADNRIPDVDAFQRVVRDGAAAAQAGELVIFGVKPTRPETGYGYIRSAPSGGLVRKVEAFIEKPDLARAEAYLADPAYSWNAGMFLFAASAFLQEMRALAPAILEAAEAAIAGGRTDKEALFLGEAFRGAPAEAIDTAVFEKTRRAAVVAMDLVWSDVGAWRALWELAEADNALEGDVVAVDATGCLVRTDGPTVALAGVENLVVIIEAGVVLVAARDDPAAVKTLVESLRAKGREDLL